MVAQNGLRITEHLLQRKNAEEQPETEEKPHSHCLRRLESLNYELVQNELYKQDWRSRSGGLIFCYIVSKWVVACLIGFSTAVVAISINVAIENTAGIRFLATTALMDSKRYASAFAVYSGSNVALVVLSALLCISFVPAAVGSGVPEVKAYLNGVDASEMLSLKFLL